MSFYSNILCAASFVVRSNQSPFICNRQISSITSALFFKYTEPLCAEPMKRKKRVDPSLVKARDDRRKKKVEKEIKKLRKHAQQLKPIDELEVPEILIKQKDIRTRPALNHSEDVLDQRVQLISEWCAYKGKEFQKDYKLIDRMIYSQQRALDELRLESEELYRQAIQIDPSLLPFTAKGPTHTPPIENYEAPDGDYTDVSRNWEKEFTDRKTAMEDLLNKGKKPHMRKK